VIGARPPTFWEEIRRARLADLDPRLHFAGAGNTGVEGAHAYGPDRSYKESVLNTGRLGQGPHPPPPVPAGIRYVRPSDPDQDRRQELAICSSTSSKSDSPFCVDADGRLLQFGA
jgi:hypothetical protein